jgi:hypothetical protein
MTSIANFEPFASVREKINAAIEDVERGRVGFGSVQDLLTDGSMTNDNTTEGQTFAAGGFRYQRAASTATDHHVTTAGGVKLYVLPNDDGTWPLEAWNVLVYPNTGQTTGFASGNAAKIQTAHDWVATQGGGTIVAPAGVIPFDAPIFWGDGGKPVLLRGQGRGGIANGVAASRANAATRFFWQGGAGQIGFTLTGDRSDTGLLPRPFGGGVVDVLFDGNMQSSIGFKVDSHSGHELRIGLCYWGGDCQFMSDVNDKGFSDSPADVQNFDWDIRTWQTNTTNEPLAEVVITGKEAGARTAGIAANTSLGVISSLTAVAEKTAVGVHFGNCDALSVNSLLSGTRQPPALAESGTVFFHADDTAPVQFSQGRCRYNTFSHVQAAITAKASTSTSVHSGPNTISNYSRGNGKAALVRESGAIVSWLDDTLGLRIPSVTLGTGSALSHYQEGTWSASAEIADAATGGNVSSTTGTATFTRIGRLVFFNVRFVNVDTTGLTAGDQLYIRGLPFACNAASFSNYGNVILNNVSFSGDLGISITPSGTTFRISRTVSGSASGFVLVSDISTGVSDLFIAGGYYI